MRCQHKYKSTNPSVKCRIGYILLLFTCSFQWPKSVMYLNKWNMNFDHHEHEQERTRKKCVSIKQNLAVFSEKCSLVVFIVSGPV